MYWKRIRRIVITGHREEGVREAQAFCDRNGYKIIRSGPKRVARFRVDPNTFHIVAEKYT